MGERKKRILFMHHVSSIGGASYCLLNVLMTIDKDHFEPIVALKSDGPLRTEIEKHGIETVFFSKMNCVPYNQSLYKYNSIKSYLDIERSMSLYVELLQKLNIDIVYLNNMMLYPYLKCAKELGLKTIIHIREHWPLDEHIYQLRRARKYVKEYADQVIAINRYSASMFPDSRPTIVYDWIDMESRYELRPYDEIFGEDASKLKVYLFTGGMLSIKGCLQVIEAFSKYITTSNSRLLIVGGINPELYTKSIKGKLKKVLSNLGYDTYGYAVMKRIAKDKRIFCIPATYYLSHIMEQAYCNLSFFTIAHANLALAECEIMGTPSIAARTDESIEYSLGEELSILYELGNFESFTKAINSFDCKYKELEYNLSKRAFEIKEMFSKSNNQKILNTIFDKFI